MKKIQKLMLGAIAATMLSSLQGCGTLVTPPTLISMVGSVVGGFANGSLMGGSTIGLIRNAGTANVADMDAASLSAGPRNALVAIHTGESKGNSGLTRACNFPNASGRGLPCS